MKHIIRCKNCEKCNNNTIEYYCYTVEESMKHHVINKDDVLQELLNMGVDKYLENYMKIHTKIRLKNKYSQLGSIEKEIKKKSK